MDGIRLDVSSQESASTSHLHIARVTGLMLPNSLDRIFRSPHGIHARRSAQTLEARSDHLDTRHKSR